LPISKKFAARSEGAIIGIVFFLFYFL